VRVTGLKVAGGEDVKVGVYINYPSPKRVSEKDKDMAGMLSSGAQQCVVTPTVRRVVEDGRAINITLLAEDQSAIEFDSMALALFTRS
jgi:hypothetical protein